MRMDSQGRENPMEAASNHYRDIGKDEQDYKFVEFNLASCSLLLSGCTDMRRLMKKEGMVSILI